MAIQVKDIMGIMDAFAPLSLTQDWDNCGLVVGDPEQGVKKVYLAIDPTVPVIEDAIKWGADMIVTHHPLMIQKIRKIDASSVLGNKIIQLITNKVALYCAHTNLDQAIVGLNDYLAQKLGFSGFEVLERTGQNEMGHAVGFGRIGMLKQPMELKALALHVKKNLNLNYCHYVGDPERLVHRVAIGSGSGMEALEFAAQQGADVFITGDIKYHGAIEAKELGISLIDATHFGTENIVGELLQKLFLEKLPGIEIKLDDLSENPIQTI